MEPKETYSRTYKNVLAHKFTDEERVFIDAAIKEFAARKKHDEPITALYGLLQKLQDDLKMDDTLSSKIIIIISKKPIDEMHNVFETNSFYAGAAWYSRELAKACYEYMEEHKGDE